MNPYPHRQVFPDNIKFIKDSKETRNLLLERFGKESCPALNFMFQMIFIKIQFILNLICIIIHGDQHLRMNGFIEINRH